MNSDFWRGVFSEDFNIICMKPDVRCPKCDFKFYSGETFWWGIDEKGHPTVENIRCPRCPATTRQGVRNKAFKFDDFRPIDTCFSCGAELEKDGTFCASCFASDYDET